MAKWFGVIGYNSETVETSPGIWEPSIVKYEYYGDIIRNSRRINAPDKLNDDINISNSLSIVSDPYALQNFHKMLYAEFMGTKWKITDVEVQYPRLTLTLGGEYTEQTENGTSDETSGDLS